MTINATYVDLQKAIADELGNRTDLLAPLPDSGLSVSPIKMAIQSAQAKWEVERFWFNEVYSYEPPMFTTAANTEFYQLMGEGGRAPVVDSLHILLNGTRIPLVNRSWSYIEDISGSPAGGGIPSDWAYYGSYIRLYPIPTGAYPVRGTRSTRYPALSADTDINVWTTYGYDLIKAEAKLILARDILHDPELAAECESAIYGNPMTGSLGYLGAIRADTSRRAHGRIRATSF